MQESKKPIIQSIRDYVMLNPDIDDWKINIDYLGKPVATLRYRVPSLHRRRQKRRAKVSLDPSAKR